MTHSAVAPGAMLSATNGSGQRHPLTAQMLILVNPAPAPRTVIFTPLGLWLTTN